MKRRITSICAIALSASMLVACSSEPETQTETQIETQTETQTETEKETSGKTMKFANGELELPENFDNFVVADYTILENFVALGVAPTYGSVAEKTDPVTDYYNDWVRAFDDFDLQSIQRTNPKSDTYIEELIAIKPDFIIVSEGDRNMDKYAEIAPTYVFPSEFEVAEGSSAWKEEFKFTAQFLGKEDLAKEKLAQYDTLRDESRAAVKDEIEGKTALVLQLNEKGFKIRMPETQASIYEDLGFKVPEGLTEDFASTGVSNEEGSFPVEQIVEFNPDYIFIQTQSDEGYLSLVGTPIWDNIQAVKDGRVYEITQSGWNHLNGYLANTMRLEDLVYFIQEDKQIAIDTPVE